MSNYGRWNLIGMLALPCFAVLGSLVAFGVRLDTQAFVFGTNLIPMLIGALISGLLLRSAARKGGRSALIALAPTLVPAVGVALWYAARAVTESDDTGREYFAGPWYLLLGVLATGIAAWVGCLLSRPAAGGVASAGS